MTEAHIKKTFLHLPSISTERLVLRRMGIWDAEDMFAYASKEDTSRFLLWEPHPNIEYTRRLLFYIRDKYRRGEYYEWGIVLADSGKLIGTCGFSAMNANDRCAEIGYVLSPDFQHVGYGLEAVKAVIEFGFSKLGLHRIEARYIVGNERSAHLLAKCGFVEEGIKREAVFTHGEYRDVVMCGLLAAGR